jgi:hypothetical protein
LILRTLGWHHVLRDVTGRSGGLDVGWRSISDGWMRSGVRLNEGEASFVFLVVGWCHKSLGRHDQCADLLAIEEDDWARSPLCFVGCQRSLGPIMDRVVWNCVVWSNTLGNI